MFNSSGKNPVKFIKMQSLGNDFFVTDSRWCSEMLSPELIQEWADRHRGVGFDQLLFLRPSQKEGVDLDYIIYNADGSEVAQCGNGARCAARYALETGLCEKTTLQMQTARTRMQAVIDGSGQVSVAMGLPDFSPQSLPFLPQWRSDESGLYFPDGVAEGLKLGIVSMGNPHAVIPVQQLDCVNVLEVGKYLSEHPYFPERTNVGFVVLKSDEQLELVVYERGVGITQACGSGACAAAALMRRLNKINESVQVCMPGGTLNISWEGEASAKSLFMAGSADFVFQGTIQI